MPKIGFKIQADGREDVIAETRVQACDELARLRSDGAAGIKVGAVALCGNSKAIELLRAKPVNDSCISSFMDCRAQEASSELSRIASMNAAKSIEDEGSRAYGAGGPAVRSTSNMHAFKGFS